MFARVLARRREVGDDLFGRIGAFLAGQGLAPEPANYALAYELLSSGDAATAGAVARAEGGVRLTHDEIRAISGEAPVTRSSFPREDDGHAVADRLVSQTRAQIDAVAAMMRAMHDETRGFGRDLAESAAAMVVDSAPASPDEILRLAGAMIARAADAEARLESTAAETESLRAELAEAQACARRDPLTGLPNRRAFEEAFALPVDHGRCLALCDVDRFKRINDGFGHAVGDRVLSAVARILAESCRGHLVTRLGGEEFAVLLACDDAADGARALDVARETVGARRFRTRDTDAPIGRVTFSAGVVTVQPGETADAALARADRLLYDAKAGGRDRVIAG